MKITMNNMALIELLQTLNRFADVTGKLGYAISKTKKGMESELAVFEVERQKLIRKYGTDDGNGNYSVDEKSESYQDFVKEVTEIAEEQVDIEFFQVSPDVFRKADYYSEECSVRDYDILEALFVEKPKNEEKAV